MRAVLAVGTERRLAYLALQDDPFFHRLPPGGDRDAVDSGLAAGETAAETAVRSWGRDPEGIAAALHVPIIRTHEAARTGRAILFSEYGNRPPSIVLHMWSVEEANRLIRDHDCEAILGLGDVGPVHLAHELYHHLEAQRLTPGTARFRIQTGRVGPLRFRTGLPSLAEIAADRFASVLLGLSVPARALSFVTIHALNSDYAWAVLARLQELPA
jgi:hypothetical protein